MRILEIRNSVGHWQAVESLIDDILISTFPASDPAGVGLGGRQTRATGGPGLMRTHERNGIPTNQVKPTVGVPGWLTLGATGLALVLLARWIPASLKAAPIIAGGAMIVVALIWVRIWVGRLVPADARFLATRRYSDADSPDAARQMLYRGVRRRFVEHDERLVSVISQTNDAHTSGTDKLKIAGS